MRDVAQRGGGPGQVTACIFALKNAAPEEWRDVQHQHLEHTGKDGGPILRQELSDEDRRWINEDLAELGQPLVEPPSKGNGARKPGNGATKH